MHNSTNVLARVQAEIGVWAKQFGDNESHRPEYNGVALKSIPPLLGIVEEVGELVAPIVKSHQGRGYEDQQEYREKVEDSLADILIFMCDFANREAIDLSSVLERTWSKVKNRSQETWGADKAKEEQTPLSSRVGDLNVTKEMVDDAVVNLGWKIQTHEGGNYLVLPEDKSQWWGTRWIPVSYNGRTLYIPNYFRSRLQEQKQEIKLIEDVDPNLQEMIREKAIACGIKYRSMDSWGDVLNAVLEHGKNSQETREQTGAGWSEPPDDVEVN